ncbi:MAG: YlbF family regulator [Lachnospiraceae bacterium]
MEKNKTQSYDFTNHCRNLEGNVLRQAAALNEAIRQSPEYLQYNFYGEQLHDNPALYERLNEMRMKKYRLSEVQNQDVYAMSNQLQKEYSDLFENELIREFLAAEQHLCDLLQQVFKGIADTLDLDLDFLQL